MEMTPVGEHDVIGSRRYCFSSMKICGGYSRWRAWWKLFGFSKSHHILLTRDTAFIKDVNEALEAVAKEIGLGDLGEIAAKNIGGMEMEEEEERGE